MADTPDPGSFASIATFVAAIVAGVIAAFAGIRRGEQRAARGHVEGDPAGLGGGAIFLDSKSIVDELRKLRLAVEKIAKSREAAEDREEQRKQDARDARVEELLKRLEEKE